MYSGILRELSVLRMLRILRGRFVFLTPAPAYPIRNLFVLLTLRILRVLFISRIPRNLRKLSSLRIVRIRNLYLS